MLSGEQIGAYSLSEPQAGSDAAALRCAAVADGDGYVHQRLQGVDHPRRHRRLLHAVRAHRRGVQRHLLLPGAGRSRRADVRQARGEDGPARRADDVGVLRRRASRRRPADRRRGPGPADRVQRAGLRSAGHRRGRDGHRAGRTRRGRSLRQRANDVRPQDHRPPGTRLPAGGHGRRGGQRPGHLPRRGPSPGRRTAVLVAGQRGQAGVLPTPR